MEYTEGNQLPKPDEDEAMFVIMPVTPVTTSELSEGKCLKLESCTLSNCFENRETLNNTDGH